MKNIKTIYLSIMAALLMAACSPDEYKLGEKGITSDDLVENIAYVIEHDANNPNIVYLKSLMPTNYTVLWDEPQGRVQGNLVTLKIAFPGTYTVRMGVETRAGVVYGPETTFTIDEFCADFVSDPLWTTLTGGVGSKKRWYIDLDVNAVSRYFVGPVYFYGLDDNWNSVMLGQDLTASNPDADSWSWGADFAGNGWAYNNGTAYDAGYMEFDLIDGAHVTVYDAANNKTYYGPFLLDTDNHTISMSDAVILHDPANDPNVDIWNAVKVLALDDSHMQLGVVRRSDPCTLSFNYISEDYLNNWSPVVIDAPVYPELQDDWRDYVEPKTKKQTKFVLDEETPFDWCNLDGSPMGITDFAPVEGLEDMTLEFNRGEGDAKYTITTPAGDTFSGTYSLSDDGIYTFSEALPVFQLSQAGNAFFKGNADQSLRIMAVEVDGYSGGISSLWLGSQCLDDQGNLVQYLGYHFVPKAEGGDAVKRYTANLNFFNTGWTFYNSQDVYVTGDGDYTFTISGADSSPYGMYLDFLKMLGDYPNMDVTIKDIRVDGSSIPFDDSVIDRGVGDPINGKNITFRRYILNPWGATADEAYKYVFTSTIEVIVHVTTDTGAPVVVPE